MPLPDERKGSRASDLIKRFQSQVDSSQEAPLIPTNSFASAGKPRLSATTGALPKPQLAPSPAIVPAGKKEEEKQQTLAELAQEKGRDLQQECDGEKNGSKAVFLRSAGLSSPPAPAEPEPEAPAPTETEAEAKEDTVAFFEVNPPSPTVARREHLPPIVTSPSIDVPADNVPGSTSLLSSPNLTPTSKLGRHSRSISVESLTPHSPASPAREGLSQPSSPATESGRLSAPPVRDDSSPPPPPPPHFESPPPMDHALPSESPTAPASPSPSPKLEQDEEPIAEAQAGEPESSEHKSEQTPTASPSRTRPTPRTQGSLSTPTASFLAKTRPRVSSTTGTPSPSSSPSRPRSIVSNASAAASSVRMSPSSSRTSATSAGRSSVVSPPLSATSSRRRASSIGSTASNGTSAPARAAGGGGGATPRKAVPTTGTPRSRKAAAEAAAAAAASGVGKSAEGEEKSTRKHTPLKSATPKASTLVQKKGPPEAVRSTGGGADRSGGLVREGKPLRMANRGRIGLAGAGMNRKAAAETKGEQEEGDQQEGGEKDDGEGEGEKLQERDAEAVNEQDDIPSIPSDPEDDEEDDATAPTPTQKVFKGFGSRPMGRIPIPVEEDGEGGMRAVGAEEVERAGEREQ